IAPMPEEAAKPEAADSRSSPASKPAEPAVGPSDWSAYLLPGITGLYLMGCFYLLVRLGWGYWWLRRFLATAQPVPDHVARLFEELAGEGDRPRLLVSDRLSVPLSCGLLRPAIVLPARLCQSECHVELRWVLAHELTHVRRHDARTTL